jgi:hypothetical protein
VEAKKVEIERKKTMSNASRSLSQSKSAAGSLRGSLNNPKQDVKTPLIGELVHGTTPMKTIKTKVRVDELAPDVFAYLRQLDGIDQSHIKWSLDPARNVEAAEKAGESQGKSGSFFFFSTDKKFIIKTMTNSDYSTFNKLFEDYTRHVSIYPSSLLARIYGVYTIKKEDMVPVHLILMGNTMQVKRLKHVFDLKGSMVNRETKKGLGKASTTLKDINILKMQRGYDKFIRFKHQEQLDIMKIMERDTKLLK